MDAYRKGVLTKTFENVDYENVDLSAYNGADGFLGGVEVLA
jgi:hypothetical protein